LQSERLVQNSKPCVCIDLQIK